MIKNIKSNDKLDIYSNKNNSNANTYSDSNLDKKLNKY